MNVQKPVIHGELDRMNIRINAYTRQAGVVQMIGPDAQIDIVTLDFSGQLPAIETSTLTPATQPRWLRACSRADRLTVIAVDIDAGPRPGCSRGHVGKQRSERVAGAKGPRSVSRPSFDGAYSDGGIKQKGLIGGKGFKGSFGESSAVGILDFQSDLRPREIEPGELIRLLVVLHDVRPFGTAGAFRRPPF